MDPKKKIHSLLETIPALSPTISKIIELTNSQESSPAKLIQAIKLDPVLTLKILNLVNSAYFGLQQQISSLNRAIVLLGLNTIKNLALSAEVLSSFTPKGVSIFNVEKFWIHSLACGTAGKLLAEEVVPEKQKHEDYFIAGLIHDIGKIFLIKNFPDEYLDILEAELEAESEKSLILDLEFEAFSLNHADVGALITEKWALADDLKLSVKHHHQINNYDGEELMPHIIYLANYYSVSLGFSGFEGETASIDSEDENTILEKLSLDKEQVSQILAALPDKIEDAKIFIQAA